MFSSLFDGKKRKLKAQAEALYEGLRKNRIYSEDLLTAPQLAQVEESEGQLRAAMKSGDAGQLEAAIDKGSTVGGRLFPAHSLDWVRENVEVFLVAIVVALSIRAYFLQPFKIPTDSMKPTLYGIQNDTLTRPAPSFPGRVAEFFMYGRSYNSIKVRHDGHIEQVAEGRFTPWFEYTDLTIGGETYRVWVNRHSLVTKLNLSSEREFKAGEELNFCTSSGDQVLVNKLIYNFRKPNRGEVFVFKTTGIQMIERSLRQNGQEGSQFYIKRCVGVPGDTLEIDPPYLRVNGKEPHSLAFDRIYSKENGYAGYGILRGQEYLTAPGETHSLGAGEYWAMGDNSFNSLDSRFWGPVVRTNLVGTGMIVYWPFGPRWGLIR